MFINFFIFCTVTPFSLLYVLSKINTYLEYFLLDLKDRRDEIINCHIKQTNGVWACTICDRSSKNKSHIVEHVESKHIDDGQSFVCRFCGKSMRTRQTYRLHVPSQHSNIPANQRRIF